MSHAINKIIEVDMDTERARKYGANVSIVITHVIHVDRPRTRQPDPNVSVMDDMIILTHALMLAILKAEKEGVYKPGEAMRTAVDNLQQFYVDATAEVFDVDPNNPVFKQ